MALESDPKAFGYGTIQALPEAAHPGSGGGGQARGWPVNPAHSRQCHSRRSSPVSDFGP